MFTTQIIILVVLIFLSAFFSGIETALMSINMIKVKALVKEGKKGSNALQRIKSNQPRLIITILIGNNLVNIGAAALATLVFTDLFGNTGVGIATGIMTFLILVFGEITPKTYASQNAEKVSLKVAKIIEVLSIILRPFVWFFEKITNFMTKILGGGEGERLSETELKTIVTMGKEQGILDKEAAEMMHNIIKFEGTKVTDVMTPQDQVEMIDGNKTIKQVINRVVKTPYSKYPVYLDDDDKIVGILDVDDVLRNVKDGRWKRKVKAISKNPYFVPESKEIDDLLTEFQHRRDPMAIVVDEYGDFLGIVTDEDILEEIVGEIFDKSAGESVYIKKVNERVTKVNARAPVEEVNKNLHLGIQPGKFNTLAGFIEHKLQRIPKKGEQIKLKKSIIEIDNVTTQEIKSVKIIKR